MILFKSRVLACSFLSELHMKMFDFEEGETA
jgi:hypothetical protein